MEFVESDGPSSTANTFLVVGLESTAAAEDEMGDEVNGDGDDEEDDSDDVGCGAL